MEEISAELPVEPVEAVPDWLKEAEAETPVEAAPAVEAEAEPAEEIPAWLKDIEAEAPEEEAPAYEAAPTEAAPFEAAPTVEGELPPGLDLSDQDAALAWLEGLAAKQGVPQEELITTPEERQETPAIWMEEVSAELPAEPVEAVPDWLKEAEAEIPEEAAPIVEAVPTEPTDEIPDWLKEVEAEVPEQAAPAVEAEAEPAGEIPAWLKEIEAEVPDEEAPAYEAAPTEAAPVEAAPAVEDKLPPGFDLSDQDAALAWLEGLAAKQGVPQEELITTPEERQETPAIWTEEISAELPVEPVEAVPDWLKEAELEIEEPTALNLQESAVTEAPEEAGLAMEVPDWLKEMAAEVQEAAVAEPQEAAVAEVQEAAVAEPQEAAAAEVSAEEVQAIKTAPGEEPLSEVVPPSAEAVPEWLKEELEEPAPATIEAPPVETLSQPTEWIKEIEIPLEMVETGLGKLEDQVAPEAELPGWITEAAAQETDMDWVPPQVSAKEEEKAAPRTLTNINSASVGELERLPGIGFVLAQSILNHRESQGSFKRIEDLYDVPGIGQGTIDILKDWITIQPVPAEMAEIEETIPLDPDRVILKQAQNAIHQGDVPAGIKRYDQLLRKLVLLNEIILDLQDALYRYPVDISIWQTLGDAYMRNNQLQDALDVYTKAEELLR